MSNKMFLIHSLLTKSLLIGLRASSTKQPEQCDGDSFLAGHRERKGGIVIICKSTKFKSSKYRSTVTKQQKKMTTMQFFEQLKDSMVSAFMNAPQLDGRNVRVPSDFTSKEARVRLEKQDSSYWAIAPQFPVLPSK